MYYRSEWLELIYQADCIIKYPRHNHSNMYVIGIVLHGRLLLQHNENLSIKMAGDFFVIAPYEIHALEPIENKRYGLLSICIEKDYLSNLSLELLHRLILNNLAKQPLIYSLHQQLIVTLADVLLELDRLKAVFQSRLKDNRQFFTMLQQLDQRLQQSHDLKTNKSIMVKNGLNQPYKIRRFKNQLGLSPYQYYTQRRIRQAAHLLGDHYSLATVAQLCGFYDQSHFIRFFKQQVGLTPKAYSQSVHPLSINITQG